MLGDQARIILRALRRIEGQARQVIAEQIFDEHLEHRNFDRLALAGALAMKQRRRDRVGEIKPGGAVGDRERHVARLAAPGVGRDRGDA